MNAEEKINWLNAHTGWCKWRGGDSVRCRLSATIYQHWQKKNARKLIPPMTFPADGKVRASETAGASG